PVQLGPGDLGAVERLGAAPGAVVDVVEPPVVPHPTGVADGRAEQSSRAGPGEELGRVLRVCAGRSTPVMWASGATACEACVAGRAASLASGTLRGVR